ncbi:hypothetical protein BHE74_00027355 [Ensete ventricosum]|nr:hypothetical protein BHE74_00027355 [Ensete ventricosum]
MHTPRRKSPLGPPPESSVAVAKLAASYIRKGGNLPIFVVVVTISVFALVMYSEDIKTIAGYSLSRYKTQDYPADAFSGVNLRHQTQHGSGNRSTPGQQPQTKNKKPRKGAWPPAGAEMAAVSVPDTCDLSRGEWVFDDVSYPLYREDQCQFLSQQVSCLRNGRRETMYQNWRWQPKGCSLPKSVRQTPFDARLLLQRLRGKRMMFVGDSMNRNQWESLVCLLQTVTPPEKRSRRDDGSRIIFTVEVLLLLLLLLLVVLLQCFRRHPSKLGSLYGYHVLG